MPTSIWPILAGALLLGVGIQGVGVLTQTRLFTLTTDARSRLDTALVTSGFLVGAARSVIATWLWDLGGWTVVAGGPVGLGLLGWAASRRLLATG